MPKITKKNVVLKKKKAPLKMIKKVVKRQKVQQIKTPEVLKFSSEKVEKPNLLNTNEIRKSLAYLVGWQSNDDHKIIYREYVLRDFDAAVDLIVLIAKTAGDLKHHPDVHLTQYRNLRIATTTHDSGGLTQADFDLASKINQLPMDLKHQ